MKNFKYILLVVGGLLSACGEDYLEVTPEHFQNANSFYQTEEQFIQAVNAAYAPLQGIYNSFYHFAELRSDNTSYQYNISDRSGFPREEIDEFRELPDNGTVYSVFSQSYGTISRCNIILDRIEGASIGDDIKSRIIGEAKFIRALNYFNLVRLFGEIPLVLNEVSAVEEAFSSSARVSVDEVYVAIEADLQDAVSNLPASYTGLDVGRATEGAARTLLAKVYMARSNFSDAIPQLREVMDLGYSLLPNYADIFEPANKNNEESIFEIQYIADVNFSEQSSFIYQFAPYNSGTYVTGFELGSGSAAGWNIPTQDLIDSYEDGDERLAASINLTFVDTVANVVVPFIEKFNHPHTDRFRTDDNFPVLRYADVLLMLAECLNEEGFTANGEAFNLLNTVRQRADLPDKTAGNADPDLNVNSQEEFRQAIYQERRVELAFEDHRWFDLLRTNRATEVMQAHATEEKSIKSSYIDPTAYNQILLLFQYPQRELDLTEN